MLNTVCIRCGKTRILFKRWKEKPDKGADMIHEQTVCPDSECQKLVDEKFAQMREKKLLLIANKNK